ncbi:hypothetical protein Aazo_5352 (plasmid) ['Nostoc azollae' 0708]|uniref:Uncharacterized protein n=1 Tax=Nostoc azollae (strain 0708) TaxID=551115 RepID=D7E5Q7_NOSA0|nr:hypothetical protein Aazo_5352 ['Nostoc azollae' 0708]
MVQNLAIFEVKAQLYLYKTRIILVLEHTFYPLGSYQEKLHLN